MMCMFYIFSIVGLTIDMEHHQLFYINKGNNSVMSCSLDGISCRLIKQFQNQEALSLTLYNSNTLYISNGEEIGKMNTTGLGYQALRKQTPQVQALLVYDENNRKKGDLKILKLFNFINGYK